MADNSGSGGISVLAFLVGALLVVVVGIGIYMMTGGHLGAPAGGGAAHKVDLTVKTPGSH